MAVTSATNMSESTEIIAAENSSKRKETNPDIRNIWEKKYVNIESG